MEKRAVFKKGEQKKFLEKVLNFFSIKECAKICHCSERTIRDWRREKFSIDFSSLKRLCAKSGLPFPKDKDIEVRDRYWYVVKGALRGGVAVFNKYGCIGGDPKYREQKWREWWEREGKYIKHSITTPLPVFLPKKSEKLAEFVGIVLGDGGITKNQITVTLHRKDDKDYGKFISKFIEKLFNTSVRVYKKKNSLADDYVVSRVRLVQFCVQELGLKIGDKVKQQVDVPQWIKDNKYFSLACLRGLVDTDGSVFSHTYSIKGKRYTYKKLSFSNSSLSLINFVYSILLKYNLTVRKARHNKEVRIDSRKDMVRFFDIVGTHNQKHLKNYLK